MPAGVGLMLFVTVRLSKVITGAICILVGIAGWVGGRDLWSTRTVVSDSSSAPKPTTMPATTPTSKSTPAPTPPPGEQDTPATEPDPIEMLQEAIQIRAKALLTGDTEFLPPLYHPESSVAKWALEHEIRRVKYVQAWAEKRGVTVMDAKVESRIVRENRKGDSVQLYVIESAGFEYVYREQPDQNVNWFGIGTRHVIELVKHQGNWVIRKDWYTDPLDEDTLVPDVTPASTFTQDVDIQAALGGCGALSTPSAYLSELLTPEIEAIAPGQKQTARSSSGYRRKEAVEFANRYCGAAIGCGNNRRYHQRYRDYTGIGGDCTNFVSQVLADPEGGGLPMDGAWYYKGKGYGGAGSRAWVRADGLAQYLSYSGKAVRIGRGRYHELVKPTANSPYGLVGELEPGDVLAYEEKGRVVHFALVTAKDTSGLPLVNTHTADRYHVPWDVGWDRKTVFWLFRIRD